MDGDHGLSVGGRWRTASGGDTAEVLSPVRERPVSGPANVTADDTHVAFAAPKSGMAGLKSFVRAALEAPFGGTNHSGVGCEGGTEGIDGHLETKLAQMAFWGRKA